MFSEDGGSTIRARGSTEQPFSLLFKGIRHGRCYTLDDVVHPTNIRPHGGDTHERHEGHQGQDEAVFNESLAIFSCDLCPYETELIGHE